MAKVMVCDLCRRDGKLTETRRFVRVKRMPELRIDCCDSCIQKVDKLPMMEYVKLANGVHGFELSESQIRSQYGGRLKGIPPGTIPVRR